MGGVDGVIGSSCLPASLVQLVVTDRVSLGLAYDLKDGGGCYTN